LPRVMSRLQSLNPRKAICQKSFHLIHCLNRTHYSLIYIFKLPSHKTAHKVWRPLSLSLCIRQCITICTNIFLKNIGELYNEDIFSHSQNPSGGWQKDLFLFSARKNFSLFHRNSVKRLLKMQHLKYLRLKTYATNDLTPISTLLSASFQ
jgi:hypothetical protein